MRSFDDETPEALEHLKQAFRKIFEGLPDLEGHLDKFIQDRDSISEAMIRLQEARKAASNE